MSDPCDTCCYQHMRTVNTPLGELLVEDCNNLIGRYYRYFDEQKQCPEYTKKEEEK